MNKLSNCFLSTIIVTNLGCSAVFATTEELPPPPEGLYWQSANNNLDSNQTVVDVLLPDAPPGLFADIKSVESSMMAEMATMPAPPSPPTPLLAPEALASQSLVALNVPPSPSIPKMPERSVATNTSQPLVSTRQPLPPVQTNLPDAYAPLAFGHSVDAPSGVMMNSANSNQNYRCEDERHMGMHSSSNHQCASRQYKPNAMPKPMIYMVPVIPVMMPQGYNGTAFMQGGGYMLPQGFMPMPQGMVMPQGFMPMPPQQQGLVPGLPATVPTPVPPLSEQPPKP